MSPLDRFRTEQRLIEAATGSFWATIGIGMMVLVVLTAKWRYDDCRGFGYDKQSCVVEAGCSRETTARSR